MNEHHQHHYDPIGILMKEHEKVKRYVDLLIGAVDGITSNGFSNEAFEHIAEAIGSIDAEVHLHDEKEERYLFPLMERHVQHPSHEMRVEHRELWRAINRLKECVKDVEESRLHATTLKELIQASQTLADLLSKHIEKENTIYFPMAKKILTRREYEQLRHNIGNVGISTSL